MEKPRIEKIYIKHEIDCDADTSYIGKFTDDFEDGVIVRQYGEYWEDLTEEERDGIYSKGREYRCFKPEAGGEKVGTENYKKYGKQDWESMESLNNGQWQFIGIIACADVSYDCGGGARRHEKFTSGGLWGVEDHWDKDSRAYIAEVEKEELADLRKHLEHFGIEWNDEIEIEEAA